MKTGTSLKLKWYYNLPGVNQRIYPTTLLLGKQKPKLEDNIKIHEKMVKYGTNFT